MESKTKKARAAIRKLAVVGIAALALIALAPGAHAGAKGKDRPIKGSNAVTGPRDALAKHEEVTPPLRIIALHAVLRPSDSQSSGEQHFTVQCPLDHVPMRYSITPAHDNDEFFIQTGAQLIDRNKLPLDSTALDSVTQAYLAMNGAGYDIALTTIGEARRNTWHLEIVLSCLAYSASSDYKLSLVKSKLLVAAGSHETQVAYCPSEHRWALGGFRNSDALWLEDTGSAPAWGTPSNPTLLQDLPDGPTSAPSGWQSKVFNGHNAPVEFIAYALCGRASGLQSFIYSTPTLPGEAFSIFASVPEPSHFVGAGSDSGAFGIDRGFDFWMTDGVVVNFQAFHETTTDYDSVSRSVRAYIAKGIDGRIKSGSASQTSGRAVAAVLVFPEYEATPAYSVTVIEFYNAALDHYFITASSNESSDLDRGVHAGWTRTGQSFKAYRIGSGGRLGRRPVCRAYGKPPLNSHFYSASPDECFATLAGFNGDWVLEASEVFQMNLPDSTTGACPAGGVPVYRTWNQRADSNHRYTTSMAMRDQMIEKGHVAEGYGSNSVTLCALQ